MNKCGFENKQIITDSRGERVGYTAILDGYRLVIPEKENSIRLNGRVLQAKNRFRKQCVYFYDPEDILEIVEG